MNKFSFALLLVTLLACALVAAEKECCSWPFPAAGRTFVNITADTFDCHESIEFTCQKPARFTLHGILGDVKNPMKDKLADKVIVKTEQADITTVAVCDQTSGLWSVEGTFTAHLWFSCGVQLDDGTWISN